MIMSTFLLAPFLSAYVVANLKRTPEELKWIYVCGGLATFLTLPLVGIAADRWGKLPVFRVMGILTILPILLLTNLQMLLDPVHSSALRLALTLAATTLFMVISSAQRTGDGDDYRQFSAALPRQFLECQRLGPAICLRRGFSNRRFNSGAER